MTIIIKLFNLPLFTDSLDVRRFFHGLKIPDDGVHVVYDKAFVAFESDEDARQAMEYNGNFLKGLPVKLSLSSRDEMQRILESACNSIMPIKTIYNIPTQNKLSQSSYTFTQQSSSLNSQIPYLLPNSTTDFAKSNQSNFIDLFGSTSTKNTREFWVSDFEPISSHYKKARSRSRSRSPQKNLYPNYSSSTKSILIESNTALENKDNSSRNIKYSNINDHHTYHSISNVSNSTKFDVQNGSNSPNYRKNSIGETSILRNDYFESIFKQIDELYNGWLLGQLDISERGIKNLDRLAEELSNAQQEIYRSSDNFNDEIMDRSFRMIIALKNACENILKTLSDKRHEKRTTDDDLHSRRSDHSYRTTSNSSHYSNRKRSNTPQRIISDKSHKRKIESTENRSSKNESTLPHSSRRSKRRIFNGACRICNEYGHKGTECSNGTVDWRKRRVAKLELCIWCLGQNHRAENCRSGKPCRNCKKLHATSLCH